MNIDVVSLILCQSGSLIFKWGCRPWQVCAHCRNTFLQGFISCEEPAPGYASVDLRVEEDLKIEDVLDDMSVVYTCIYIVDDKCHGHYTYAVSIASVGVTVISIDTWWSQKYSVEYLLHLFLIFKRGRLKKRAQIWQMLKRWPPWIRKDMLKRLRVSGVWKEKGE